MTQAGRLVEKALDILLPPQCQACGELVGGGGMLCLPCWESVQFLNPPHCAACGLPFEFDLGEGTLCGACIRERPVYRRARAAVAYGETSRRILLAFKHGDRTEAAPALGRWLLRAGADLFPEADALVPVPLHWTRLFLRRYNQAALLAREVGRLTGLPVHADLLLRGRRTPSQGHLTRNQRHDNVKGAFRVRPSRRGLAEGKRLLLVDDVLTTGATVEACARVLLRAGAAAVDVLTVARVMRPEPD